MAKLSNTKPRLLLYQPNAGDYCSVIKINKTTPLAAAWMQLHKWSKSERKINTVWYHLNGFTAGRRRVVYWCGHYFSGSDLWFLVQILGFLSQVVWECENWLWLTKYQAGMYTKSLLLYCGRETFSLTRIQIHHHTFFKDEGSGRLK